VGDGSGVGDGVPVDVGFGSGLADGSPGGGVVPPEGEIARLQATAIGPNPRAAARRRNALRSIMLMPMAR
jgi:hypothetical protein